MSSCNFLEVCRDVTKTARKIPQSDYLSQGNYKIFDQGKQYIAGYTNDSEGIVSDYPYIVFGDHTRILKFVAEPCFIGADGVKLLKVYNEDFTPQYVYYALLAQPIENQGYSRHFKYLKELNIAIYTKEEQNAIVSELDKIQAALDNKKEQLKKLDELIQSKFYEMFGDPVVNDKGWEEHKLVEIVASNCSLSYGIVQPGEDVNDGIPIVRPVDFNKDIFVYRKNLKKIKKEISDAYKRTILKGDEILFCVRGTTGTMGLATKELVGCNVTRGIVPIYFESNQNKLFHFYQLLSPRLQKEIADKTNGAALKQINIKDLKQLLMYTPPLPLQEAFAAYVEKVEQAKAIVNQEIAHLQELLDSRMDFYFRK